MILLKNCSLFDPNALGNRDILIGGGRVVCIAPQIDTPDLPGLEVLDVEARWVIPGLVDSHIHFAGAGGEGGPVTRTSPIPLDAIIEAGITTVVGCLGTDGITRGVESVLMEAKALRQAGLSAWIYTGSYQIPPPTITGDVARDLALISEVIGVGEIALADHRSSDPSEGELLRLARRTHLGALLGNKKGIINIHLGDQPDPFGILQRVAQRDGVGHYRFLPTHCNRSRSVLAEAAVWGREGYVDLTASSYPYYADLEIKPSTAVQELLDQGVPFHHITISSDAGGSLPQFDEHGTLVKNALGHPASLLREVLDFSESAKSTNFSPFALATAHPADILGLSRKGRIRVGNDADLAILRHDRQEIHALMAGGRWLSPPPGYSGNQNRLEKQFPNEPKGTHHKK
ncbi:MAG: beta-aspartyl-peptidase [Candidatus Aminicenantes bacterium]|nr:beta-aspartyl-peptidase [Candidatus Aminicenantes bacterium]